MFVLDMLRPLSKTDSLPLSIYLAFGILLSQLLNIYTYYSRGGTKLMTWYRIFGFTDREPTITFMGSVCIVLAVVLFLSTQLFAHYARGWSSPGILTNGLIFVAVVVLASQLMFSSVMRLSYEVFFCLVVPASILMQRELLGATVSSSTTSSAEYGELLGFLKFIIPLSLALPILVGGSGMVTSFFRNEPGMLRTQLYRHVAMGLYFEVGVCCFLLYPALRRVLLIRAS